MLLTTIAAMLVGGSGLMDWDAAAAPYACHKNEPGPRCAARIDAMLRKELAIQSLPRAMPGVGCSGPQERCSSGYDGCTPVAALMIATLGSLGRDAAVALPTLKKASGRSANMDALVQAARANAGDLEMFDVAVALTATPSLRAAVTGWPCSVTSERQLRSRD